MVTFEKEMRMGSPRNLGLNTRAWRALALALICGPAAGLALAEPTAEAGAVIYQDACASCHGSEGHGDGPQAALLTLPVPDLTQFASRNGGQYDIVRVIHTIDGRAGLAAHGGPMPLFGGLLTGPAALVDAPDGTPVTTTEPILAIALWLESQQETSP